MSEFSFVHQTEAFVDSSLRTSRQYLPDYATPLLCDQSSLLFVSLIVPAFNEAAILERNLSIICNYMRGLEDRYRWEIVVVNDGSGDQTAERAEAFASNFENVHVVHHLVNFGLGQALKTGIAQCQGDYIVTLDLDLSYSPDHIEHLLTRIQQTQSRVVVASPYMKGGKVSNVPWLRRILSIWANRFLSTAAKQNVTTLTGLVRVYDAEFLRGLTLRSPGMEVNPEILHKASLLHERVDEIPAHLCWSSGRAERAIKQPPRKSSMKILRHTWSILFFGFLFRPVMFFIIPSLVFFGLALYSIAWVFIHSWGNYQRLAQSTPFPDPTEAVAAAFQQAPHTFVIGGMLLMLSIQLFSLGILSVQSKRYFEEIFYLGHAIHRSIQRK